VLFAVLASTAISAAPSWNGMSGELVVEFDVPADALRPGPATAVVVGASSLVHSVHFAVVPGEPAHLRLVAPREAMHRDAKPWWLVRVIGETGGSWETKLDAGDAFQEALEPLFIGNAEQLASLQRNVRALRGVTASAQQSVNTLRIQPRLPRDCRALGNRHLVIAATPDDEEVAGLVRCASRGARVLVIGALPQRASIPANQIVAWGLGELAFAPSWGESAAVLAVEMGNVATRPRVDQALTMMDRAQLLAGPGTRRPIPFRDVFAALGAYVFLIGPVGYWVASRARKAWLAWAWFPLAATGTTAALLAYSSAAATRPAKILQTETSLTDLSGSGLRYTSLVIEGSSRASYSLRMPWEDADLGYVRQEHRFGSPDAEPIGAPSLVEDAVAHTARLSNIAVARLSAVPLKWAAPVQVARLPTLEFDGSKVYVRNPLSATLTIGRLFVRGRIGRFSAVKGGDRKIVEFDDRPDLRQTERGLQDWTAWDWEGMAPANGFLLAAEYVGMASGEVAIDPATPVAATTVRLVAGPVPAPLSAEFGEGQ